MEQHTHTHTHTQRIYYLGQLGSSTQIPEETRGLWKKQERSTENCEQVWISLSLFVVVVTELRDMHKEQENNKSFIPLYCAKVSHHPAYFEQTLVFYRTQTKFFRSVGCTDLW